MFTVEVLVKAVVVARRILKKQWRWLNLAGVVASPNEVRMLVGIADVNAHGLIPSISYVRKTWIERGPKSFDDFGKRIAEVLVLATPEAMPSHDNAAAKKTVIAIKLGQCSAFFG